MRILLDACVPRKLKFLFGSHDVWTARERRLNELTDAELLAAMTGQFDVLITTDKNIRHQQNVTSVPVAIIVLRARSNRLADLAPVVPAALAAIRQLSPGEVREVFADPP